MSPTPTNRPAIWKYLCNLATPNFGPWLVTGDLNEIVNKEGGFLVNDGLLWSLDLPSVGGGGNFTWHRNSRGQRSIARKLDRGLANLAWENTFPHAFVEVLCRLHSYYNPY